MVLPCFEAIMTAYFGMACRQAVTTQSLNPQILVEGITKSLGKYGDCGLSAICFSAKDFCTATEL
jgi:hypothetical protein